MKLIITVLLLMTNLVQADEIGCVTTTWKLIGANHKICVDAFNDPTIPGVTCHISQARTGGIKGAVGIAEDPSRFSLACRQTGPITVPPGLKNGDKVFSEDTSLFFKTTDVIRMYDSRNNTLVYLAVSQKIIEGAPASSLSTVPVMHWDGP